ncbi:FAD-dependent oxidoreductase [Marinivivus vitaminiproducens]|uniref:FAD-dependent oxidoreductase n=1 Tax=Marinivivus vitaminiproducens TaxID=3035935 RepID=UPI0027A1A498|nr:FAD-dependent monooxygenase [Geminicoccaceae bacterium SCSIO 64248]
MTDPILIVGAGPTGLTAAFELSRMGVPVRLVDRAEAPATTSRAIGVQARTLELFEQRGLAAEMVRVGNPARFGSIYGGGARVFHLDFARIDSPYPYILFISQAETERILREALAGLAVEPEWGTELIGIGQNALSREPSPIHAILRHADGAMEHVRAPWLISAEGAHSVVRTTLDLPYEGHTREEQYALGDVRIEGELADTDFHIFSSEHGFMGLFPMGGDHFRLIASHPLSAPVKETEPALGELQAIYDQRSHLPARFHDMAWSSWFRINSRMVPRLKVGRLLLGGDVAHIHSPAGAQGMNTGIQDMVNLCWKLALVTSGQAPLSLLETYEQDRLPVMRGVLSCTDHLTDMIGSENAAVRAVFNHVGPYLGGAAFMQRNQTAGMSQIALAYRDSPLSDHHHHGGSLHAGDRVPPLNVRHRTEGRWTDAPLSVLVDPSRFTLLLATRDGAEAPKALNAALPEANCVAIMPAAGDVDRAHFDEAFGRECAVLVRPDGYAALTSPLGSAADRLDNYRRTWLLY